MRRYVLVGIGTILTFVACAAASSSSSDQRLATALVAARADVPTSWAEFKPRGPLLQCVATSSAGLITAQTRSVLGTPNSGVSSVATVLADRRQARRYYRAALAAIPACVRHSLSTSHPTYVWHVQPLTAGRYGLQSGAWRLRFLRGTSRGSVDWAVVDTGRAVLVDIFMMGAYDAHWKDISAARGLGGSVIGIEQRILTNAARRAAAADSTN